MVGVNQIWTQPRAMSSLIFAKMKLREQTGVTSDGLHVGNAKRNGMFENKFRWCAISVAYQH